MKKWFFWLLMLAVSLINGAAFYMASASAMDRGADGVENQAGLLFIPVLWMMAIGVLAALNVFTWMHGHKMAGDQKIAFRALFKLSGLSAKEKARRAASIAAACLLMLFGYSLFAAEKVWAVSYTVSGGALLLLLYAWGRTPVQSIPTTGRPPVDRETEAP